MGLTGRGALSTPARALLTAGPDGAAVAMGKILPEPIDHFLVQADLTVVVPGPLKRELSDELSVVATVESAGSDQRRCTPSRSAAGRHGVLIPAV